MEIPRNIEWIGGAEGHLRLLDQTRLPGEVVFRDVRDVPTLCEAIRSLRVRGAPAIGIAAAYGVVLGVRRAVPAEGWLARVAEISATLAATRPTAVNLAAGLRRMERRAHELARDGAATEPALSRLLEEARAIHDEDAAMCRRIGWAGEPLIEEGMGILTHCHAGALATGGIGTALAPMYVAHELGRRFRVYARETRPLLQGARLTAWELVNAGIDVTLLCDSAAGALMAEGKVQLVITGADRIVANGDVANKIGTYELALLAEAHGVPFHVAAPSTTFDLSLRSGAEIPIEFRDAEEIRCGFGRATAPADVPCYSPAFDVTPARLVRGFITEQGLIEPIGGERIRAVLAADSVARTHAPRGD
jgi:methylthioribose-1-phosphate isomerase